jgi:26S proteasome regulatory subunit N1
VTTWHLFQAFALISEYISRDESIIRIGAILGLGIAYAGSQKEEVQFFVYPQFVF